MTMLPVALLTRYPVVSRKYLVSPKTSGSFSLSHASLQTTSFPEGMAPATSIMTRFPPSRFIMRSAWTSALLSSHIIAGRSGFPSPSTGITPIICPAKPIPMTWPGLTPLCAMTLRVPAETARHQSSGSCSAQFGTGYETSYGSKLEASMFPAVSEITDLQPPVPTSWPITNWSAMRPPELVLYLEVYALPAAVLVDVLDINRDLVAHPGSLDNLSRERQYVQRIHAGLGWEDPLQFNPALAHHDRAKRGWYAGTLSSARPLRCHRKDVSMRIAVFLSTHLDFQATHRLTEPCSIQKLGTP